MRVSLVLLFVVACGSEPSPPPAVTPVTATTPPPASTASGNAPSSSTESSLPIPRAVLDAICHAEPCGGDESSVEVFRDGSGAVKRLFRLYGSCFHSPGIYFDETGRQTEIFPDRPVLRDSPEMAALQARHDEQRRGLTAGEVIRCSDGLILPPRASR